MLTPIPGAYGSGPSLVRGDVSLREEGVNANRKRINTPVHVQMETLSSKSPEKQGFHRYEKFFSFFYTPASHIGAVLSTAILQLVTHNTIWILNYFFLEILKTSRFIAASKGSCGEPRKNNNSCLQKIPALKTPFQEPSNGGMSPENGLPSQSLPAGQCLPPEGKSFPISRVRVTAC